MIALKIIVVCWMFFLGLQFGGFYNVYLYRISSGTTLFENSSCPKCGSVIYGRHLLPLVGWLLLRGRCRVCRQKIDVVYPLVESACSALFGGIACLLIAFASDWASIERAIGTSLWSGFVVLYFIGAIVFSRRGASVPWGVQIVAFALVLSFLFPARFLHLPWSGGMFDDVVFCFLFLSTTYSIVGILALSFGYELTGPRKKAFESETRNDGNQSSQEKNDENL